MRDKYWRPPRNYYDADIIKAKKDALKDMSFMLEYANEEELKQDALATNPKLEEAELEEILMLFRDLQRERGRAHERRPVPRVADLARRQREVLGGPNNVVRVHAWRPEAMLRWLDFYEYISKGPSGLSRAEREMIGVVVSAENRCIF